MREFAFINFLYIALRELNAVPEFRMRIHDGKPYIYNKVDCSFTVANNYGYFVNRSTAFCCYNEFYEDSSILVSCEVIKIADIESMELLEEQP